MKTLSAQAEIYNSLNIEGEIEILDHLMDSLLDDMPKSPKRVYNIGDYHCYPLTEEKTQ